MYEGFVLITLVVLVVLAIRPAVKYDSPLVIHKPGLYHATLAPRLGRVQYLIEQVAEQFSATGDIATRQFKMHDAAGKYLLAAGFRAGVLYFQAIPYSVDNDCEILRKFSDEVLVNIPLAKSQDMQGIASMRSAVEQAAKRLQIDCLSITNKRHAR